MFFSQHLFHQILFSNGVFSTYNNLPDMVSILPHCPPLKATFPFLTSLVIRINISQYYIFLLTESIYCSFVLVVFLISSYILLFFCVKHWLFAVWYVSDLWVICLLYSINKKLILFPCADGFTISVSHCTNESFNVAVNQFNMKCIEYARCRDETGLESRSWSVSRPECHSWLRWKTKFPSRSVSSPIYWSWCRSQGFGFGLTFGLAKLFKTSAVNGASHLHAGKIK